MPIAEPKNAVKINFFVRSLHIYIRQFRADTKILAVFLKPPLILIRKNVMQFKQPLYTPLGLGICLATIATLMLAGCGGGSGGGSAAATSITLTPIKGKFTGTCNISIATTAAPSSPIYSSASTIAADGTVSANIPAWAVGPFVISVLGDASGNCKYYNDNATAPANLPLLAGERLNALVPSTQVTANANITVSSLTEMAYQAASAVNGGNINNLSDNSQAINVGIVAAMNLAGIASSVNVANFFQPPPVIPAFGVAAPTDPMGMALVAIANQNPTNPLDAVTANALMSAALALQTNPATAAQATALATQANAIALTPLAGTPSFSTTSVANSAATLTAITGASASSQMLADLTSTGGLRTLQFGWTVPAFGASVPAMGGVVHGAYANNSFTFQGHTMMQLLNGAWTPTTNSGQYVLASNGWIDRNLVLTNLTMNSNGTAHVIEAGYGTHDISAAVLSLDGMSFAETAALITIPGPDGTPINATGVVGANAQVSLDVTNLAPLTLTPSPTLNSPVTGNFTAGAVAYVRAPLAGSVASQDVYEVNSYPLIDPAAGIDKNAVYALSQTLTPLTTLPASNQSFCLGGYAFVPAPQQLTPGSTTYLVSQANGGGLAPIPCGTQGSNAMGIWGDITLTPQTVNGQSVLLITSASLMGPGCFLVNNVLPAGCPPLPIPLSGNFFTVVDGAVHIGTMTLAGQPFPNVSYPTFVNSAAVQQFSTALGARLPIF